MTIVAMRTDIDQRCQPGDLWQLGRHRIKCGDSTNLDDLHSLLTDSHVDMVFSDPPYGINLVPKNGHVGNGSRKYRQIVGDADTQTAIASYQLCQSLFSDAVQVWWGANYYANVLTPSRCWLIWDKKISAKSFADAELAWTNHKSSVRIFEHQWNGACRASERNQVRVHPTQKPVKLAEWVYERYGNDNDLIFDPFLGSGITILAAEQLGQRRCYGIEIDPYYCDVVLARYEALTGNRAILLERNDSSDNDIPLLRAA